MRTKFLIMFVGAILVSAMVPLHAALVFQAEWEGGSYDADINRDGGSSGWGMGPYSVVEKVNMVAKGVNGRMAIDATNADAHLRYYVGGEAYKVGTYIVLFKLNGWTLANSSPEYYLGGLNNYVANSGASVRNHGTYVRAHEGIGGSPYIQPGGSILPNSTWILMAYTYNSASGGTSQLHLLDAFTGVGVSSAVASGYNNAFDLLTVGNAGAPGGGIQPGGSIHGWVDGVRAYNTALSLAEIQAVRSAMIPEPATVTLFTICGLITMLKRKR